MTGYIVKRLLQLIPIILGVTIIIFLALRLAPGDPAKIMLGPRATPEKVEQLRAKWGLDKPIYLQYITWLSKFLRGDLGRSIQYKEQVLSLVVGRAIASFELMGTALFLSVILGLLTGIISAVKQNSIADHISRVGALFFVSMPSFWLGLLMMLVFALWLEWFPTTGRSGISSLVLPALTLGLLQTALISRLTRSSMLEVVNKNYVRTARAKGLWEGVVIYKHALRNALIPVVTMIALRIAFLFSGAMVTETVFAWPGMGRLMVLSVLNRDYPVVQAAALLMAICVVLANLFADITYAIINPQIRYE